MTSVHLVREHAFAVLRMAIRPASRNPYSYSAGLWAAPVQTVVKRGYRLAVG